MAPFFDIQLHVLPGQYIREYPAATADSQEETLRLHINQYTPANRQSCPDGAVTVIAAHANGFPKELYEPLWEDLYQSSEEKGLHIRSIWIADVAHQGMSSVLNEHKLGNDRVDLVANWNDHARDLLYITNQLRDKMPRPLVGIGHSLGANNLASLALMHPRLLSSLVLIDPVIALNLKNPATAMLTQLSTFRRDWWPSKEDALAAFRKQKFYQTWDKRVLQRWLDTCLRETPTALFPETTGNPGQRPVTLLTSKHQEVFTFSRPNFDAVGTEASSMRDRFTHPDLDLESGDVYPFYRPEATSTFRRLPHLRPSVLYVHGGRSELSARESRAQRMDHTGIGVGGSGGAVEGRVQEVLLEDGGHLMPMEMVGEVAEAAANWLASEMERWRNQEAEFNDRWSRLSALEKQTTSAEWKRRVGGDPRGGSKKSQL